MAMRQLLRLARRSHRPSPLSLSLTLTTRSASTSVAAISDELTPPPPTSMLYDRLAEQEKTKIKQTNALDTRFLQHGYPLPTLTNHTHNLSAPLTRVTTLPNGLRVATEAHLAAETATVGVWIDAGSRFETDKTNGVAHFVEHMIFKGTKKRGARDLEVEVENMGGHLNAYTSREQTTYYAKVLSKDAPKALDILGDILQNSKFDEFRIERERDVILREMEEVGNQPEEVIFDHLHATAFQHLPLGRTILGTEENVRSISRDDILQYISTHYTAPRMVISAAGNVKHEDIVEQAKRLFKDLPSDSTTTSELVAKEPYVFTGSEVRMVDDDIPIAQFAVAFEGASWTDPDSVPLMVMQSMLGSWNKNAQGGKHAGSDLAQKIAINGIAESMMAFNTNYKDTGLFGVYATAKPDCLDDLAYAIMKEFAKFYSIVSEDDLTRAQNQLKTALLLHIDGTSPVAEDIGRQLLTYGRRLPYTELFARIDAVDTNTVRRVAHRFIHDRDVAIAAVGPVQDLPDYNWFRRRAYLNLY